MLGTFSTEIVSKLLRKHLALWHHKRNPQNFILGAHMIFYQDLIFLMIQCLYYTNVYTTPYNCVHVAHTTMPQLIDISSKKLIYWYL